MKVKIWNPDQLDEEDADEVALLDYGELQLELCAAAEDYAEKNYVDWEYPDEITLHIREGAELHVITVEVCQEPVFSAAIKRSE